MFQVQVGDRTAVFTLEEYNNGSTPRVGDLEYDPDHKAFFRFLKNTGASAIPAQMVAVALTTNKSAYGCTLAAATDALVPHAGVRVAGATSMAQNEFGWFQVSGQASWLHSGGAAVAAEEAVVTSATVAGKVEGGAPTVNTVASALATIAIAEAAVSVLDTVVKGSMRNCVYAP